MKPFPFLSPAFFDRSIDLVARDLIGCELSFDGSGGVIVETEAYDQNDPASHCYGGLTARNATMFGPPGHAYVYRSYGIHWCLNISGGREGFGCGVLIRALEPTIGIAAMQARRGLTDLKALCSGPGKVCAALGITRAEDGKPINQPPFSLKARALETRITIVGGPRIGLTKAADTPWRFGLAGSRFVSRALPRA